MKRPILIASAWPYANSSLHLGHIAGLIGGDILARYFRANGDDVLYVSGTDCFGTAIELKAIEMDKKPIEIVKAYHEEFCDTFSSLDFSYDNYSKTIKNTHQKLAKEIFLTLFEKGYIYKEREEQLYSKTLKKFLADRFIVGECHICNNITKGDYCDACNSFPDLMLLKNPLVAEGIIKEGSRELEKKYTTNFYLKMSIFKSDLEKWSKQQKSKWRKNAENLIENALKDLPNRSVSRGIDWGIDVPVKSEDAKKIYVWFEALIGYVSATKDVLRKRNIFTYKKKFNYYFKNDNAVHYYIHAKDNILTHTTILPVILKGYDNLHLPDVILSSEFLKIDGAKISKSKGAKSVMDFVSKYGSDEMRYFLIAYGPENQDTDFDEDKLIEVINGELVAKFGNLINRVIKFSTQNYKYVKQNDKGICDKGLELMDNFEKSFNNIKLCIEKGEFKKAIKDIFYLSDLCNKFAQIKEPWKNKESEQSKIDIWVLLYLAETLSVLISPFLPKGAKKIREGLGVSKEYTFSIPSKKDYKTNEVKVLFKKFKE